MNKKYLKGITSVVSSALLLSTISAATPSPVSAATTDDEKPEFSSSQVEELNQGQLINELIESNIKLNPSSLSLEDFESINDIPKELLDPNYYSEEEIIYIPESYLNPNHPDSLGTVGYSGNDLIQSYAIAAAAGIYAIPGIGQVTITVTGAIIIGGAVIMAGSWLYNQVSVYFSKKAAEKAADKIPNDLKSGDMQVDLGKFKNKHGKTAEQTTSSPPFTNGKWRLEKDTAGHIGYNGEKKAWKVWKKGASERTASLDKNGNVIDE
ncbi:hypothetical protein ACIP9C_15655 [Lysinibacillus sp. NPDC093210]|uniref:hypothetical protein n=1 Tax=Lysinibacillus sp. NPDC093210 TaxID=3364133 RepID=UPI0037F1D7F2